MHVVVVARSLPFHQLGGMEAVAWDLCRSLAQRGVQVTALTTATPKLPARSTIEGVEIVTLDAPSGRYSKQWWQASREAILTLLPCDIVLSVSIAGVAIAQDKRFRAQSRAQVIFQCHGTADTDFRSKIRTGKPKEIAKAIYLLPAFLKDFRYRAFDAIVSIGEAVTGSLTRPPIRWATGPVPVTTIANGIDEDRFRFDPAGREAIRREYRLPAAAPVVVSASRLHVQKGVAEGLAGFARAREALPGLHYLIAGDGPDLPRLEQMARNLGVVDAVRFAGAIARERLPQLLGAGDIFLFSSVRQEGFALGPLEAAACGLPSVLSSHLAIPGLETALVDPRSPRSVADGLIAAAARRSADRASLLPEVYSLAYATSRYIDLFAKLSA